MNMAVDTRVYQCVIGFATMSLIHEKGKPVVRRGRKTTGLLSKRRLAGYRKDYRRQEGTAA